MKPVVGDRGSAGILQQECGLAKSTSTETSRDGAGCSDGSALRTECVRRGGFSGRLVVVPVLQQ